MTSLYERDGRSIAAIERLRFFPAEVERGHGSILFEPSGRKLLDLSASWTASGLGHGHPAIVAAVSETVRNAAGASALSAANPQAVGLAEDLLSAVPGTGERRVYLGNSGSDANDVAIRACRHATGRPTVLAFEGGYHGGIGTAMAVSGVHVASGQQRDNNVVFLPYPNPLRPANGGDIASTVDAILDQARHHLATGRIACLIVEPILSDGGLVIPPAGFLSELHALCGSFAVPLICDEVKVGLARPGSLHAFALDGIEPEIVVLGKALGGGLPLSAAVGPATIMDTAPASALLTTAGNPICAAAGRAVIRTLIEEDFAGRARTAGARLFAALQRIADGHGIEAGRSAHRIGEVRGQGLVLGVELVADRASLEPDNDLAQRTVYRAWQLGAIVHYVGGNVLEITPPLVITDEQIDQAADIIDRSISDAIAGRVTDKDVEKFVGW
ncbi:aspartate aminotransferase family protein [Paenarthrobacter sp. NPDC090520]|uniref:aspartate aminotransferase family protein n=1 Tax=Paenarthrobacter sp. NPDC090520 TaxID=3364382 RepID=UPI00380898BE